ncbi:FAD:protein FMN transferase [Subsaximicrobium wynnwilliamsii]|uniref:FAD:protein FMN transferase n=1 Tax=Subsaximicrobium wynnwilliamsii TaxID=291179 RepID=A0A5C6ZK14_9FLAO|nr:FAD:protein FMN transferase [Subsaximicrobium wynnwilliamsii]TXD84614.1 FAD:protein FMN transferase [Subsaximicrobium wynnwilliamsii]TXD90296.1 FAD:protein FMN transferase [Subsaximicrobium wynnwilliamsii]TXE04347.1 FAD:protein FMN transferase [Subsaximicrobium wynnwilliamsii]
MKHLPYLVVIFLCFACNNEPENTKLSGPVFGTSYNVIYDSTEGYTKQFDSLFTIINQSMSTYIPDSDISKINRNEDAFVDSHFIKVFEASKEIYQKTNGVFDPTIGAVVNAWNFGPEGRIQDLDSLKIDSLMLSVGLDRVSLNGNKIIKPKATFIDFNAIAKGYGVDVIADFLESQNIENYLVEIGGEIRCRGINTEKQQAWRVGLDQPRFDGENSVYKAINLKDQAMATSGTYRKFKTDAQGKRYAHIINTKTGYPSKTNILSVSVIAENCMVADAYATAFQAMEVGAISSFLEYHPEMKAFLIIENESNELENVSLNGFPE